MYEKDEKTMISVLLIVLRSSRMIINDLNGSFPSLSVNGSLIMIDGHFQSYKIKISFGVQMHSISDAYK